MRFLIGLMVILMLFGCAGEDSVSVDSTPPDRVLLIPHLGDTGEYVGGSPLNFYDTPDYENNGIDAVPGGNWIQVQWQHPIDNDIGNINIYRFSLEDYQDYVDNQDNYDEDYDYSTLIDVMVYVNEDIYIDKSTDLLNRTMFYFIGLVDDAGNETLSDTLGYRLDKKAVLISPGSSVVGPDDLTFEWQLDSSQLPSDSRLLLFDQSYQLCWTYSPLEFEDTIEAYTGEAIEPQQLIWRVDVNGPTYYYEIDGKNYTVFSGSESNEISIYLQR